MTVPNKACFYDLSFDALVDACRALGLRAYRARQLDRWRVRGVMDFSAMTDLSQADRAILDAHFDAAPVTLDTRLTSALDGTQKALFRLRDGEMIETVAMRYGQDQSICLSSQVGCGMGCAFCASTGLGFVRNLTVGEMYGQVVALARTLNRPLKRITVMGIGEPLQNLSALCAVLKRFSDPQGLAISPRRMTVSTCGLPDEMLELASVEMPITLAVSLHAPDQARRARLMPIARQVDLDTLLAVCRRVITITRRRLTFEYALFADVNDRVEDARALAERLKGMLCHVNLIMANETPSSRYTRTTTKRAHAFMTTLRACGVAVSMRRELGLDIEAACGQLRRTRKPWISP